MATSQIFTKVLCEENTVVGSYTYVRWLLKMVVTATTDDGNNVSGTVDVYFTRDSAAATGGYYFNGGNKFSLTIGGKTVKSSDNIKSFSIDPGKKSDNLIWSDTWSGTRDSSGAFNLDFSASFEQTQRGYPWKGTVSGTFTLQSTSNIYVYTDGKWHLGTAYVYNSGWKKSAGKVSLYNNGWKK